MIYDIRFIERGGKRILQCQRGSAYLEDGDRIDIEPDMCRPGWEDVPVWTEDEIKRGWR